MKVRRLRWPVGRLIWESKGHGMKAVAAAFAEKYPQQQHRRDKLHLMVAIVGTGLVVTCVTRTPPATPGLPGQSVTVNLRQGSDNVSWRRPAHRWGEATDPESRIPEEIAGDMGERHPEESGPVMMPHEPLPGQKVTPCPGSSQVMYGGCWYETANKTPCPPDLFQEGQKCYVPIHAKEPKPSCVKTQPPNPEHR